MLKRTSVVRANRFSHWPWPKKLPLREGWFKHLSRNESIAAESKQVHYLGDLAVCGFLLFAFARFYADRRSKKQQTRLCHLTGFPPAIVAQEFDFTNPDSHRKVDRATLDQYRNEFASARASSSSVESFIFKY